MFHRILTTSSIALFGIVIAIAVCPAESAIILELPPIGSDVGYNYAPEDQPIVVAESLSPEEILRGEIVFAENNRLFVQDPSYYDGEYWVITGLGLHGPGVRDVFLDEPFWPPFQGTMQLTSFEGAVTEPKRNSAFRHHPARNDYFGFDWQFSLQKNQRSFSGLRWDISENAIPGRQLPAATQLTLTFSYRPIVVVPEPSTSVIFAFSWIAPMLLRRGCSRTQA